MPARRLPPTLEPHLLAAREVLLEGSVPISAFSRLVSAVDTTRGEAVQVHLQFQQDDRGRSVVTGSLNATVSLHCDRCLEQIEHALVASVDAVLVRDEARAAEVQGRDTIVLDGPQVELAGLLEDDLLLSLPMVACSDGEDCPRSPDMAYGPADAPEAETPERHRPFAALRHLVADNDTNHDDPP